MLNVGGIHLEHVTDIFCSTIDYIKNSIKYILLLYFDLAFKWKNKIYVSMKSNVEFVVPTITINVLSR